MGTVIIGKPRAVIKTAVDTLASDPACDPCDAQMAQDLCEQTGVTEHQRKWLMKFLSEYGFDPVPA